MDDEIDWISEGEADQADQAVKTEEEECREIRRGTQFY